MKKTSIFALCTLLTVSAFIIFIIFASTRSPVLWEDDFENNLFRFNSSKHRVYNPMWMGSEFIRGTFADFDNERHPGRAMIIGEVAGPSINRIIDIGADSHVITPILVHYILFVGEEIDELIHIQVGEIVDVMENYFFVTPETRAYARGVPLGQVITNWGARPMESGNRYLLYIHHGGNWPDCPYLFNGERVLAAMHRSLVYRLGPIGPIARLSSTPTHGIPGWHEAAIAIYGQLHYELPTTPPPPVVIPRTPDELNIIIQGAPIATAIYDSAGNRLIQDGLGLYRQTTGGGRERVGQRVSISHALRRFQYILEPGEYIFKDLNFAQTNLPSNIQVLGFEDYERAALTYYADSPSSSQMELRIMSSGAAELIDKTTNTIIPPTEVYPIPM